MPTPVTCPTCGERLDIPADLRGTPVRCAACGDVFTPPPTDDEAIPEVRPARPVAPDFPPVEEDYLDPRDRPRPRKRGGSGWVLVLLGGLGLMTCACCGGCGALFWYIENPTFEPYSDPDGRFSVELPGPPVPQRLVLRDGDPPMKGVEARRETAQESYFVYAVDVPNPPRGDDAVEDFLTKAAKDLAAAKVRPGQPTTTRPLLHGNYPAVEVHVQFAPFEPATGLVARVVLADNRLYAIGVTGQIVPEMERVEQFLQSLQIPEAGKKDGGKK